MWGATPIDQMLCRIAFKSRRYDGQYTPGSTGGAIHHPGSVGVLDWGSVAVDPGRGIAIVNASYMPYVDKLVPRTTADAAGHGSRPIRRARPTDPPLCAAEVHAWTSAAGRHALCGRDRAVPLAARLSLPSAALGRDRRDRPRRRARCCGSSRSAPRRGHAPLGLALPIGIFNQGGAVTTAGGVTFIGAAVDGYIRAYDTATGRELWKADAAGTAARPIR